jgi:nucleolar protein 58
MPEMVNDEIVAVARALFECDSIEKKYSESMRFAGDLIKDISGINCEHWSLLKIVTALKMIWWPEEAASSCEVISKDEVSKLVNDAKLYEIELSKESCWCAWRQMEHAHKVKTKKKEQLSVLLDKAKQPYQAEQAEAVSQECNTISSQLAETVAAAN